MVTNQLVFMTSPWASGNIRGVQVAEKLGAICDPKEYVSKDSIFIFVKSTPNIYLHRMYIDIIDAYGLLTSLTRFPQAKLIAINDMANEYLSNRVYNKVITIPEHHCNFENFVREDREVKTVGFVGYTPNFSLDPNVVKEELAKIGLDFIWSTNFNSREDVCDFYKKIDIQLTFRPKSPISICPAELKNPLKLANAGSFKIPSVCCAEPSYIVDFEDCFLIAENIKDVVEQCKLLKNDTVAYKAYSQNCYSKAKKFHLDLILPLYEKLRDWELDRAPTGEKVFLEGFEIGDMKIFQIKDKDELVAHTKLVIRTINIGGTSYKVGGLREFKVLESHRRKGIGTILFKDTLLYAKNHDIDMLAGFSRDIGLKFFLRQGCELLTGGFNGQVMFYYKVKGSCKPKGAIDLMGTMW